MRMLTSMIIGVLLTFGLAQAEEYRAIFWNMHSGDSDASFLGGQMAEKESIDFWGLSEVQDQAALDAFVAALQVTHPNAVFVSKISEDGGSDRLAIIYRSERLTLQEGLPALERFQPTPEGVSLHWTGLRQRKMLADA